MALYDMFRPRHRHSDPAVRADAVRELTDEHALLEVARDDLDAAVRRLALARVADPEALRRLAVAEADGGNADFAQRRATRVYLDRALAGDAGAASAAMEHLTEARELSEVAERARIESVRVAAKERLAASEPPRTDPVGDRVGEETERAMQEPENQNPTEHSTAPAPPAAVGPEVAEHEPAATGAPSGSASAAVAEPAAAATEAPASGDAADPAEGSVAGDGVAAPRPPRPGKQDPRSVGDPASNLAELESLSADLERVLTIGDIKLKTLEKRLTTADNRYPKLLPLPSAGKRQATERFQEARRKLVIRIGELKEVEEWKRWANVPAQEALIAKVDSWTAEGAEAPARLADLLKTVQEEWKTLGPAPQEKAQDLWQRFKDATDKVYDKVKEQRAQQNVELEANLEKKRALCVKAEELSTSTDWARAADQFKRLQAEWKAIGPVPRKQADAVWRRFRGACDAFFEARRPHLERSLGEKQANLDRKRGLVERLEALLASDEGDWERAAQRVADARREWKMVGMIPHKDHDALHERFNQAADAIYARRDAGRSSRVAELRATIEGPLTEAEALLAGADGAEVDGAAIAQGTIKARAALREAEHKDGAPPDLRTRVEALTRSAVEKVPAAFKGTDLDPEQTRKRKEKLVAKIEELVPSAAPAASGGPLSAADMAARLKAALADRALGGVLSQKVKAKASRDVIAEAREAWSRLGPVPGEGGEALEKRFSEACRRASAE